MLILRLSLTALAWALLLSSTVGLAAHEHLEAFDSGTHECVADHSAGAAESTELRDAHRHQHQCLGFHLSGQRALSVASEHATFFALPHQGENATSQHVAVTTELFQSILPRGPPRT